MSEVPPQFAEYPRVPQRPRVRIEAIGEAWKLLTQDLGTWALAGFITSVFAVVAFLPLYLVAIIQLVASRTPTLGQMFIFYVLIFGAMIALYIAQGLGYAGMYRMALKKLRGEPIAMKDYFAWDSSMITHAVASLIIALGVVFGSILCYLPGFIVGGLLMLTQPIIVARKCGVGEAVGTSWNLLKGDLWMATGLYFLTSLVAGLGAIACGIGMFFTLALLPLTFAIVYRDFSQGEYSSNGPTAPYDVMAR